jgi:hypothetical protein
MGAEPANPNNASPGDPGSPRKVPWYKYKYSLMDWVIFVSFAVIIFLIVCTLVEGHV